MKSLKMDQLNVALVGYGYWGKKVYETLKSIIPSKRISVVEPNLKEINYNIKVKTLKSVLLDDEISHIFIITPEETHFQIAKQCLEHNKNIFVEKPLCLTSTNAYLLQKLADERNLQIYVDYIFLHDPYVRKIKSLLDSNYLGKLTHIESVRHFININKPNITVFDDLAIHDIYLGKYFFGSNPKKIESIKNCIGSNQINQAYATLYYDNKKTLSSYYSWIQPKSSRKMTFIGDVSSLVWDKNKEELFLYKEQKVIDKFTVTNNKSALELSIRQFTSNQNKFDYFYDTKILERLNHS